ncbi:MAG: 50S ribosomal protein L10 [Candidatus Eisenbacteria bacterium]|uniref:Large ribosomal subunit protein uL10 n=1 Tax=Eiseniibacteriota bacterium TaxID=2212470 RepID=A0A948RR86_UNCEI|nr:50S ribosomal protein L10 [Candidatus Eisenbacteria bacterium]MBU1950864.1 50S ribosomal protein L10 [Candidatus Eisenbacteria bacterium]MBU2689510.1 50S ribosomal protein L10 [Candidatus Eisenbacteria bacterium]
MLKRADKEKKVDEIVAVLKSAKGVYLADYSGMDVATITELRQICRKAGIRFEVIKNTLGRFAAEKLEIHDLPAYFKGPNALATSETDEVAPARVLTDFAKEHKGPEVKVAFVEGKIFEAEEIKTLASLPPRDILLSNFLRAIQGTLTQFVSVLKAPLRDLANVLDQVAKSRNS